MRLKKATLFGKMAKQVTSRTGQQMNLTIWAMKTVQKCTIQEETGRIRTVSVRRTHLSAQLEETNLKQPERH